MWQEFQQDATATPHPNSVYSSNQKPVKPDQQMLLLGAINPCEGFWDVRLGIFEQPSQGFAA
jgi:hypothetical protein